MLHGPAKRRQMARSILPSRARKEARARLRLIHRAHRRRVAQLLNADRRRLDSVDVDELFDLADRTTPPDHEVREVVFERRLEHYNEHRPHRSLHQRPPAQHDTPTARYPASASGGVQRCDIIGGLIHEYRAA